MSALRRFALEATAGLDAATKGLVIRKMLTTATVVAVLLVLFGELLTRLLHFSTGALAVAGGIVLLIIAYLLNPVGIVVLVTISAEAGSVGRLGLVIGILALVLALDVAVFRWANKVSERLDESRMLVTEKVFGFLLAALAVQLVLTGLDSVGVIHLVDH